MALPFKEVADFLYKTESVSSRLDITNFLAELFKKTKPEEARKLSYLLLGKLAPDYEDIEIGVGEKLLFKAMSLSSGHHLEQIQKLCAKIGEIGKLAEELMKTKRQKQLFATPLTLEYVYEMLYKVSTASGEGSIEKKIKYVSELFNLASPLEARYIARILVNKLRAGIGEPTILDALSWAKTGTKELREQIERAYNLCADIGLIAETTMKDVKLLKDFTITPLTPIRPALAERLPSAEAIFEKLGTCAVEYKYDGFRMQIHKKGKEVRIFSRRLERMDQMFPDVVKTVKELPYDTIVFEGEALAYNEEEDRFYSFQETMHRRRKYGIDKAQEKWPLHVHAFDIMYLDGKALIDLPLKKRRAHLDKIFPFGPNLRKSHYVIAKSAGEIQRQFDTAMKKKLEGIMAKNLKAHYIAGKRGFAWIKFKKSYGKAVDTVDAVIVGYYRGTGHRAKFGFGGVLVAVYNDEKDEFETIAKVGSGFTEEEMQQFKEMLDKIRIKEKDKRVNSKLTPDFWVEPKYVIEIMFDDITRSQQHTAGEFKGRGFALRFPRFFRLRDKSAYDATTVTEIEEMYNMMHKLH